MSQTHISYYTNAVVNPYRIVKRWVATSGEGVIQATGATALLIGVNDCVRKDPGEMVDVQISQIAEVEYGAAIMVGDPLTSDANGKAIKATPSAGEKVWVVGFALRNGGDGQVRKFLYAPQLLIG